MNFNTLNCIVKLKKFFFDLSRIEISALMSSFRFEIFLNFDSQMHKTHKNICLRDFDFWTL